MEATTDTRDQASPPERVAVKASEIKREYTHGEDKPVGGHLVLMVIYNALAGAFLLARARSGKGFPERIGAGDPLRAPFTERQEEGGPGEVEDTPRGTGLRRAIGELLVCPFCMGQWVATAILAGLAVVPRTTRYVCSIFAAVTISDFLQIIYKGSEEKLL
jgi:uncharacterized protein DUF1360